MPKMVETAGGRSADSVAIDTVEKSEIAPRHSGHLPAVSAGKDCLRHSLQKMCPHRVRHGSTRAPMHIGHSSAGKSSSAIDLAFFTLASDILRKKTLLDVKATVGVSTVSHS